MGSNKSNSGSSSPWNGNTNFPEATAAYSAGGAVRLGTSSKTGEIVSREIAADDSDIIVALDVKGWTTVEGRIVVSLSAAKSQQIEYSATMSQPFERHSVTFTKVPGTVKVTIATTNKRAFVDNVSISTSATSGISTTFAPKAKQTVYTLSGQRIKTPSAPGIYIIDGKKRVVK